MHRNFACPKKAPLVLPLYHEPQKLKLHQELGERNYFSQSIKVFRTHFLQAISRCINSPSTLSGLLLITLSMLVNFFKQTQHFFPTYFSNAKEKILSCLYFNATVIFHYRQACSFGHTNTCYYPQHPSKTLLILFSSNLSLIYKGIWKPLLLLMK